MTNWQFVIVIATYVLSVFGFILAIPGSMRFVQASLSE